MSLVKTKKNGNLISSGFTDFFDTDRFFGTDWLEKEFSKWIPAVNITENGKQFSIQLSVPGFSKGDFKVNIANDVLTISAEKQEEKAEQNERYTRREFFHNSFSRSFTLPATVAAEKIDAKYENGILNLCIPKKEEVKGLPQKEIKVS